MPDTVCVYDILWDTEGLDPKDFNLPEEVNIDMPREYRSEQEIVDYISEALTKEYGWAVLTFRWIRWTV